MVFARLYSNMIQVVIRLMTKIIIIFISLLSISCENIISDTPKQKTDYNNELDGLYKLVLINMENPDTGKMECVELWKTSSSTEFIEIKKDKLFTSNLTGGRLTTSSGLTVNFIKQGNKYIADHSDYDFGGNGYYLLSNDSLFRYTDPIGQEDQAKPFWIAVKVNYSTSLSVVKNWESYFEFDEK